MQGGAHEYLGKGWGALHPMHPRLAPASCFAGWAPYGGPKPVGTRAGGRCTLGWKVLGWVHGGAGGAPQVQATPCQPYDQGPSFGGREPLGGVFCAHLLFSPHLAHFKILNFNSGWWWPKSPFQVVQWPLGAPWEVSGINN